MDYKFEQYNSPHKLTYESERMLNRMGGVPVKSEKRIVYDQIHVGYGHEYEIITKSEHIVFAEFDANKLSYFTDNFEKFEREANKLYVDRANAEMNKKKLEELIQNNAACKKAWDNFMTAAKLVSGDADFLQTLDKKELL